MAKFTMLEIRYYWKEVVDVHDTAELREPACRGRDKFEFGLNPSGGFDNEDDAVIALEDYISGTYDTSNYTLIKTYSRN